MIKIRQAFYGGSFTRSFCGTFPSTSEFFGYDSNSGAVGQDMSFVFGGNVKRSLEIFEELLIGSKPRKMNSTHMPARDFLA